MWRREEVLLSAISVLDYQRSAREKLSPDVWDYIEGGAGSELTVAANRHAFERVQFRPRIMVDVSICPTRTSVLGAALEAPLGVAPIAFHELVHTEAELATARGAAAAGTLFVVPMFASRALEKIAAESTGPLWLQLYWLRRRDVIADLARRAAVAGFGALVLTVDAPRIGRRLRDLRNGFAVDPDVEAVNLDPDLMASTHRRRAGESAIAVHAAQTFDPTLTWADLAWLRGLTDLPVVVKGVLTAEDAVRAVDHGAAAIIVSNHGGRQLDGVAASLHALVEVVDAVAGACPVLMDGGVRSGSDVFAALAVGASAVLVGRPAIWALAHDGADGVAELFGLLREELTHTMALAGRPALADIDRSAIRLDGRPWT
jgi:4-hydroxymandelate oxidase